MARETRAQREAREAAEQAQYEADRFAAWPYKLLLQLERATNNGFDLVVLAGKFNVSGEGVTYKLPMVPSCENDFYELDDLELALDGVDRARAEAERRYNLKRDALAKLSEEEREVLGL